MLRIKRATAGLSSAELVFISADNVNESVASRTRRTELLLCEPTERRRRVDHRKRCIGVTVGIACDKSIAVTGFRGCRADSILEIRPGESQRTSDDVGVDRCNGEDANETLHALASEGRVTSLVEEVEDCRDKVCGHHTVAVPALDRCPQCSCDIGIWWTVENDIEEDVEVEEKTLHRYFRLRCRRCASAGTPRAAPRSMRSNGV